jgi:hypothetical protein
MFGPWMRFSLDSTMLAVEAQIVMGFRLIKLGAGGTAAQTEAHLMLTEKASAFVEAAATIASGGIAHKVIAGYPKRVRANARRLRRDSRGTERLVSASSGERTTAGWRGLLCGPLAGPRLQHGDG